MKIQDIGFLILIVLIVIGKKPLYLVYAGIVSLIIAMPLFYMWIFFSAQRLTWYAAVFFSIYIAYSIFQRKEKI